MNKRFSEEKVIGFLREADAGGVGEGTCGLSVSDARRLKALEAAFDMRACSEFP
jgi:hypothetical protein